MNKNNAHILKTWLGKARATEGDRPQLGFAHIQERYIWASDGFRAHISRHVPAKFPKPHNTVVNLFGAPEDALPIDQIKSPSIAPIIDQLDNFNGYLMVNPLELITRLKWLARHENQVSTIMEYHRGADVIALSVENRSEPYDKWYGITPREWTRYQLCDIREFHLIRTNDFRAAFNIQYMIDALWIFYYENRVYLATHKTGMISVFVPGEYQIAAIMQFNTPKEM